MRVPLTIIALLWSASAFAHPCADGAAIVGAFVEGDAGGFRLEGHRETFVLAGLANASGPLPVSPGARLSLHPASSHVDRYGRAPVFAFAGETWLQADALTRGIVADPLDLAPACAAALLAREPATAAVPATDTERLTALTGRFAVVTGRVRSIGDRERRLYLNFGKKWDEDFTVSVAKTGRTKYRGDLAALQALEGRTITVRGALDLRGGPLIRLTHDARISIDD